MRNWLVAASSLLEQLIFCSSVCTKSLFLRSSVQSRVLRSPQNKTISAVFTAFLNVKMSIQREAFSCNKPDKLVVWCLVDSWKLHSPKFRYIFSLKYFSHLVCLKKSLDCQSYWFTKPLLNSGNFSSVHYRTLHWRLQRPLHRFSKYKISLIVVFSVYKLEVDTKKQHIASVCQ